MTGFDTIAAVDEREVFRAAARKADVAEDAIDWWLGMARPYLDVTRGEAPGGGHFGGLPELPASR